MEFDNFDTNAALFSEQIQLHEAHIAYFCRCFRTSGFRRRQQNRRGRRRRWRPQHATSSAGCSASQSHLRQGGLLRSRSPVLRRWQRRPARRQRRQPGTIVRRGFDGRCRGARWRCGAPVRRSETHDTCASG